MDPGQSTKPLSQDQGFDEGRTDEHKSLPHFSFLLFKVDVVLDFWILRIPTCRPNSFEFVSATARVLFVPTVANSVPVAHLAKSARLN